MIATILPNASGFPGVNYNEKKVMKGKAILLEMSGFGILGETSIATTKELVEYLEDYSARNARISKPQFHLAISCKGYEMNSQQLLDFTHDYLKEMGYGDPDQPILIYYHTDTDNNHLHIITSRVAPDGTKIDHNNERRRSQKVLNKLLGENAAMTAEKDIKTALGFNFRSTTQFKAVLEAMNYECYEKDGRIMVKKGGMVQGAILIEELVSHIKNNTTCHREPNYQQLKGIFLRYRDLNSDLNGLKSDLRKIFGIELIMFGKKDSPYGYVALDFRNKTVIEGAKIMSVKVLNDFSTPEEHFNRIDSFITQCFQINPSITTRQLNRRLKRMNAYIRKEQIIFGNHKKQLKEFMAQSLAINNKISWIKMFNPQSQLEIDFLSMVYGIDKRHVSKITINSKLPLSPTILQYITELRKLNEPAIRYSRLKTSGFRILQYSGNTFAYNPQKHIILDLDRLKINVMNKFNDSKQSIGNPLSKLKNTVNSENGTSENREWEVGSKKDWEEESGKQMSY